MGVVADKMGMDTCFVEHYRHGVVKRFYGPPSPVKEVVAPCVQFPPGRHTGKASGIAAVKLYRPGSQAGKIYRLNPTVSVSGKKMAVKTVKHDHYRLHGAWEYIPPCKICQYEKNNKFYIDINMNP
jgi:hypothetical protein